MSKLTSWLAQNKYDYLELSGNPQKESRATSCVRSAACKHFKSNCLRPVSRNLYLCELVAIVVTLVYMKVRGFGGDSYTLLALLVLALHCGLILLRILASNIVNFVYSRRVGAYFIKCTVTELPEWVVHLPELRNSSELQKLGEPCEWVLLEFGRRSYALSMITIDRITCDDFLKIYLMQI